MRARAQITIVHVSQEHDTGTERVLKLWQVCIVLRVVLARKVRGKSAQSLE